MLNSRRYSVTFMGWKAAVEMMNCLDETHKHKGQQKSQTQKNERYVTVTQAIPVYGNGDEWGWWPLQERGDRGIEKGCGGAVSRDRSVLPLGLAVGYVGV